MPLGYKCNSFICQCVIAFPTIGCETIGNCCQNYFIGLIATREIPYKDSNGDWQQPKGATRGYIVDGMGFVLTDPGNLNQQAGDVILAAAVKGEKPQPMNEAWFETHWLDVSGASPSTEYELSVWRPGDSVVVTVYSSRI